ncbi:MAG: HD-GYP domain-containing protein (c-di-GMP phosphodiesterase class II) [Candidatus Azotimanducaceae bacterium]|jgi:HD-GYP domain-containing protein (c-di-GMP phosphodiesterase class II)
MDSQQQTEQLLVQHNIELNEDLTFLLGVSVNLEQRTEKWQNRTPRSLNLALTMNCLAGYPVDNEQLTAAILAHDIGMGFLPHKVLNKSGQLSAKERKTMQAHIKSAADLIHRMQQWDEARDMILSHHERVDGSGYPNQRTSDEICHGAKILAIVDAFTAQGSTNVMHGVMEIHRHSGTHFSDLWVKHFDAAVKTVSQST